ncbi:putative zinc ribbon protein [Serratia fonticola]
MGRIKKHCKTCNTGIYSISRGDWSWNYNQKEDTQKSAAMEPSA